MTLISVKDRRIQTAELSDFHYRDFLKWSFVNQKTKAAFGRDILMARTTAEGNQQERDQGVAHFALVYSVSVEELSDLIIAADQNGVSTVELHGRLERGLRGEDATKRGGRRKSNLAKDGDE